MPNTEDKKPSMDMVSITGYAERHDWPHNISILSGGMDPSWKKWICESSMVPRGSEQSFFFYSYTQYPKRPLWQQIPQTQIFSSHQLTSLCLMRKLWLLEHLNENTQSHEICTIWLKMDTRSSMMPHLWQHGPNHRKRSTRWIRRMRRHSSAFN